MPMELFRTRASPTNVRYRRANRKTLARRLAPGGPNRYTRRRDDSIWPPHMYFDNYKTERNLQDSL
jgi:hypothetical protein